ncbi:MAG: thermonuclease family protein [Cellulophaga sp.]
MKNRAIIVLLLITVSFSAFSSEDIDNHDFYVYKALITAVYDGDTVTADIDLGFNVWLHGEKLRLSRINTPKVKGKERPQGLVSRDWLREKIKGKEVIIKTIKKRNLKEKKGKFGRYLVEIYFDNININDELVKKGLAEYKQY